MDLSVVIGILVYVVLLILGAVSVAHKTLRVLDLVIDLVQEIAGIGKPEAQRIEVLDSEVLRCSVEQHQEHFSGQGS